MLLEWLVLTGLLLTLVVLGTRHALHVDQRWSSLHRSDALLRDSLQPLTAIPPSGALTLVEIDQASLDAFGRWPWPRSLHAVLIDRLVSAGVSTIGLDVLFVEPAPEDAQLAHSVRAARAAGIRVVQPISIAREHSGLFQPLYPVADLGDASELGHVHFGIDGDGLVRGQYLDEGGFPSFALRLLPPGQRDRLPVIAQQALDQATIPARDAAFAAAQWPRRHFVLLPKLDAPARSHSFVEVLRRPPEQLELRGRTVLIGATAVGIGDQYANSIVGATSLSAGVELHAAAYSAIEQNRLVLPLQGDRSVIIGGLIVLTAMIGLYRSSARIGILLTAGVLAATLGIAALFLRAGFWWPPSATLLLTAMAYPLWSWRRLEAATSGLVREAQALQSEPMLAARSRQLALPAEEVSRSVQLLQYAAERSVELRRLLQSTLQNLPHPAVLTDDADHLVFSNDRFSAVFGEPFGASLVEGEPITRWLERHAGLKLNRTQERLQASEQRDALGRDWLIDTVPMRYPDGRSWTLIQMVDLSPIRAAQREREQTLRFLSHDLRSPLLSILTLMREQRDPNVEQPWLGRVENYAERSLELADGFVQLARAENTPIEHQTIDLADLMIEASDLCWALARERGIRIDSSGLPQDALVEGDAQLLRRALVNLIDNAIKFSPRNAEVVLSLGHERERSSPLGRDCWCAGVQDQGQGLAAEELRRVFEPFWRSNSHHDRPGAGLGLTFVRVVTERHRGQVSASLREGGGARFEMRLPSV